VLADAQVDVLFSSLLVVSLIAALVCFTVYALIARLVWRRPAPETLIGSFASGYVNANNIGIPVSVYVLGNAAYSAPLILLQLLIFAPLALSILDRNTGGGSALRRILLPLRNPLIFGTVLGVLISVFNLDIPDFVMEPLRMIGAAAVPVVLISFGMSLSGQRPLAPGSGRRDVLLAVALKLALMPVVAWAVGRFLFGMEGQDLLVVTVLAALPTAQNVFNYAQRYQRGEILARDAGLITTIGSIPVLILVAALLAP
jgi:malonate transporter